MRPCGRVAALCLVCGPAVAHVDVLSLRAYFDRGRQGHGGANVARKKEALYVRKGAGFQAGALKRLRRGDDTWEADFRRLPQPLMQGATRHLGLVVEQAGGGRPGPDGDGGNARRE